jgi:hypothetical protein
MNPFEYWYKSNITLRKGLILAFKYNIDALKNCSRLRDDCEYLFEEGDFLKKNSSNNSSKSLKASIWVKDYQFV